MGSVREPRSVVIEYEETDESIESETRKGGCEERTWPIARFTEIRDEFSDAFADIGEAQVSSFAAPGFRHVHCMHGTGRNTLAGHSSSRRRRHRKSR
jgi:hypothetical protein